MCSACKLSKQQPSLWNSRQQQGAQSCPRKASEAPRSGRSQFWPGPAATRVMCLWKAAKEKAGPMPLISP